MSTRTRHRITKAVCHHDNRDYTVTFQVDGVHVREKYAKTERLISLQELVSSKPLLAQAANRDLVNGSPSEHLDVAACDLAVLASELQQNKQTDLSAIWDVKRSLLKALSIVRSLETLA